MKTRYDIFWWDNIRTKLFDNKAEKLGLIDERKPFYTMDEVFDFEGKKKRNQERKTKNPFLYFVYVSVPEFIEDALLWPQRKYSDIFYWIYYRTTGKYNVIKLDLKPGYYDADTKIEHALWTILVDFIEVEAAWMSCVCDDEKRKKFKRERRFGKFRSRELGIEWVDFQIACGEPDSNGISYSKQKVNEIQQLKDAYLYYKDERITYTKQIDDLYKTIRLDNAVKAERSKTYDKISKLENKITKLDDKHLINIVKNRQYMWT